MPAAASAVFVHILESWEANPASPDANRTLNVYSNAPFVSLTLNGATAAPATPMPALGWVRVSLPYVAGTVTAHALASDGTTLLATASKSSWGAPAAIVLTIDAPSAASGTGGALFLDGEGGRWMMGGKEYRGTLGEMGGRQTGLCSRAYERRSLADQVPTTNPPRPPQASTRPSSVPRSSTQLASHAPTRRCRC